MIVALSGLCVLIYGLQTVFSLVQSVPNPPTPSKKSVPWSANCVFPCAECTQPPPKKVYPAPPHTHTQKRTEGSLCICRDDAVSTFSEFIDY